MVLVLRGGGALGAYQADVYEGITETGIAPSWIAGVSTGAINAALIGGNPPGRRVERLREFWDRVSSYVFRPSRPSRIDRRRGYCAVSLYAFFTAVPGYYAALLPVAVYRCRYRFDERTNVDLLHTWWLLRLLSVFLLACPFLIIPVFLGFFNKQPDAEDRTESPAAGGTRIEISGRGTWTTQADGRSQSSKPDRALSPIERRAA
jgi:Patatin-like phospholipase